MEGSSKSKSYQKDLYRRLQSHVAVLLGQAGSTLGAQQLKGGNHACTGVGSVAGHISGTGGQLDFLTGAAVARGGKAFLCMTSTHTDCDGVMHSRIVPSFRGDIVTSPRSQAHLIATEYGVVNLAGRSTWERAELLVSIAHPMFREELIRAAEQQKIWYPHNRR